MKNNRADNILLVTNSSFPYGTANANTTRLLSLGLRKNDRKVEVLLQYEYKKPTRGNYKGVNYRTCNIFPYGGFFLKIISEISSILFPPIYIIMKKMKKDINCVIIFNNYFYESFFCFLVCKVVRIPIIQVQVDLYDLSWYKQNISDPIVRFAKFINHHIRYFFLNKCFDGILVMSRYLRDHFYDIGV